MRLLNTFLKITTCSVTIAPLLILQMVVNLQQSTDYLDKQVDIAVISLYSISGYGQQMTIKVIDHNFYWELIPT